MLRVRPTLLLASLLAFSSCTREPASAPAPKPAAGADLSASAYGRALQAARAPHTFRHWPSSGRAQVAAIADTLVAELAAAGEAAPAATKIACFQRAVSALNALYRKQRNLIETSEAEELVDMGNKIALAARLIPKNYGDGEGPLSAGREW